ncbi:MAG: tripartite tricarboxylate transporter substrate-binding protein, partial [Comamonas sp.]
MTNSLRRSWLAAGALAVLPMMAWAQPQSWPARPVRVVVSYPAGGVSDVVARALGDKLTAQLGQPIVVENKAGAGGAIGLDQVAKAQPDGYTLGFSAISPLALSPHLGKLPFDPAK